MTPGPGLHPQVVALMAAQQSSIADAPADLAALRAGYLQSALALGGGRELVAAVDDVVLDGRLPARVYVPELLTGDGLLVWLHGGGWVMGDLEGFDHVCRALANAGGHRVVSVDYRLAPEHPFPAPVDDARAALSWAVGHGARQLGTDPGRVALGGDSAGGALAAAAAHDAPEALAALLLVYPALDGRMASPSYDAFGEGYGLRRADMRAAYAAYAGSAALEDPALSPGLARDEVLSALPPTLVALAGHDVLRDDGAAYARRLQAAGVDVRLAVFDDMVHGFLRWAGAVDRTRELLGLLGAFTRERLA